MEFASRQLKRASREVQQRARSVRLGIAVPVRMSSARSGEEEEKGHQPIVIDVKWLRMWSEEPSGWFVCPEQDSWS
jgi:hypothetical protein